MILVFEVVRSDGTPATRTQHHITRVPRKIAWYTRQAHVFTKFSSNRHAIRGGY